MDAWRAAGGVDITHLRAPDAARDVNMTDDEFDDIREMPKKLLGIIGKAVTDTIAWIFFVATVLTTLFGLISWRALNKFRTFRNYVLVSAIFADMLLMLMLQISDRISEEELENNPVIGVIALALLVYFQMSFQCWLIVLCYVFSVDFVQVFHYDNRKKYIWSNLFAWGVPFLIMLLYVIMGSVLINMAGDESTDIFVTPIAMSLLLIPVAISLVTCIAVLSRLFCGPSTNKLCGRFTIAILIFLLSNVFLITVVPEILEKDILAVDIIGDLLEYMLTIALIVFIVVLKGNWKLWRDFFNKRFAPESGVMLGDLRI